MSVPFDEGASLADRMRRHARDRDHLYAHLMRAMADDWEQGGPVRDVLAGHEKAPRGSVLQLRLLAGLFRIVLTGRAPELKRFYPCLGGTAAAADAWPPVRAVLAAHVDELRQSLAIAPQTNEVGRANALVVGLFAAAARTGLSQVRLLEPGASAGLNLLVDRFRFVNHAWAFGSAESPVVLRDGVEGDVEPVDFRVVRRRGCDLSPVDVSTEEGRLRLRSFVWPFHVERHQRLEAALAMATAGSDPPVVDRAPAGEWLEGQLREPVGRQVLTVVWHSITQLYWPAEESRRVDEAVAEAASRLPVARVCMEYRDPAAAAPTLLLQWSAGGASGQLRSEKLGTADDHGFPVRLTGDVEPGCEDAGRGEAQAG